MEKLSKSKAVVKSDKPVRERFQVGAAVILFKGRDVAAKDAKGIKILPLKPESTPEKPLIDWQADGYVVWFSDIDILRAGLDRDRPVFIAPYRPKTVES